MSRRPAGLRGDLSMPRTSSWRPLRHVPSETSWSASAVSNGSMDFGSLASRASTYFRTTSLMAASSLLVDEATWASVGERATAPAVKRHAIAEDRAYLNED